jgi:hypothetical protein
MPTTYEALLLDIGFVIIDVTWAAIDAYERGGPGRGRPGRSPPSGRGTPGGGPTSPARSPADRYWGGVARSRGFDGMTGLFRAIAEVVPDELFVPDAVALMRDARGARRRVGCSPTRPTPSSAGTSSPGARSSPSSTRSSTRQRWAPEAGARAYLTAADALGVGPTRVVFLDDTPECVDGANRIGMHGILVDPFDRTPAFDRARAVLGLPA